MIALVLSATVLSASVAAPAGPLTFPIVGDYDAELRRPDGHVDCSALVQRLKDLGVNTYFWLIWHADTDWDDLREMLPLAKEAGINVWVYLVPPSEPPPSKPFGLDFVRWGQEIAKLSLKHSNLVGWVIDDFYANSGKLTPQYIEKMQRAAKAINPRLVFYPLMYFREIHYVFTDAYAPVVDGVVVAYPADRADIERASKVLRDQLPVPASCRMTYPWDCPSKPGEAASISATAKPLPGRDKYTISFKHRDSFTGPTAGYHFMQLLIDDHVVWDADVAGGKLQWRTQRVDVTKAVAGKDQVTVTLRCYDKKGVSNFGVFVEWADLQLEGFQPSRVDLEAARHWRVSSSGHWQVEFHPKRAGTGRFRLPFLVMPAGSPGEFKQRHAGSQGSPEEIARQVAMVLDCVADGLCDGMVIYCLPKKPGSRWFDAVREVIQKFNARSTGRKKGAAGK